MMRQTWVHWGVHRASVCGRGEMQKGTLREHVLVLLFDVAGERYGVETSVVREIVRAVQPTRLPSAPGVVLGLINMRGELVPVIDLRARFGVPPVPLSPAEAFVLVWSGRRVVALRADQVHALIKVARDDIHQLATAVPHAHFTESAVRLADGVLLLCDVERFLDEAEQATLREALSAPGVDEALP